MYCNLAEGMPGSFNEIQVTLSCYSRYERDFCLEDTVRYEVSQAWNKTCIGGIINVAAV